MTSVYIMTNDIGLTKIGISKNPTCRQAQLKNSSGMGVYIRWVSEKLERSMARDIERKAHYLLRDNRMQGEWFSSITPNYAASVISGKLGVKMKKEKIIPLDNIFGVFNPNKATSCESFNNGYVGAITVKSQTAMHFYKDAESMSNSASFAEQIEKSSIIEISKGLTTMWAEDWCNYDKLASLSSLEMFAITGVGSFSLAEYREAAAPLLMKSFIDKSETFNMFNRNGDAIVVERNKMAMEYGINVFASKDGSRAISPLRCKDRVCAISWAGDAYVRLDEIVKSVVLSAGDIGSYSFSFCVECCLSYENEYFYRLGLDCGVDYIKFKFNGKEYSHDELPLSEAVQINIDLIEFI